LNVVDSSGWLEYFRGGPNAEVFAPAVTDREKLVVPVLTIYEVVRKYLARGSDLQAMEAAAAMQRGRVVDLDTALAVEAARLGCRHKLPMADAVILATARAAGAVLWTMDGDFEGLPGVEYIPRRD